MDKALSDGYADSLEDESKGGRGRQCPAGLWLEEIDGYLEGEAEKGAKSTPSL